MKMKSFKNIHLSSQEEKILKLGIPFILLTFLTVLIVQYYPNISYASTITLDSSRNGLVIGRNDTTYDSKDLVIDGANITIDGTHTFGDVSIVNGAIVTHTAGLTKNGSPTGEAVGMRLNVDNLTIDATSKIDVSGKGYPNNTGLSKQSADKGQNGSNGSDNNSSGNIVLGLKGGSAGGQGGDDNDHYGPGGGGGYVGGGGSGIGKRSGGGGGGASSTNGCLGSINGGCGHNGDANPDKNPQLVSGGTLSSATITTFLNSVNPLTSIELGYGGGGGSAAFSFGGNHAYYTKGTGGPGGGSVSINANSITVNGKIIAVGNNAPLVSCYTEFSKSMCGSADYQITDAGSGAGGSIFLHATNNITVGPGAAIDARGGNSSKSNDKGVMAYSYSESNNFYTSGGGAGGGGIIILYSPTLFTLPDNRFKATGGLTTSVDAKWQPYGSGGAGIVYVKNTSNPLPTVTLTASPISVNSGTNSTITWSSTNATSCTASGAWAGFTVTPLGSGSTSRGPLTTASTFTLTCTGPGGSASASASVSVVPPPSSASKITYNPYINPDSPKVALPGFGPLQAAVIEQKETAP